MGLSVAQGTIDKMGGGLRYERESGVSRFVIDLPVTV